MINQISKSKGQKIKGNRGSIIVVFIIILAVLTTMVMAVSSLALSNRVGVERAYQKSIALNIAEAGINKAIWEIKKNSSLTTAVQSIDGGQYEVALVPPSDSSNKYIISTAYVPTKANPKYKKAIKIKLTAQPSNTDISFGYAIQSDVGGTFVKGAAEIHGSLYSNGNVDISGSKEVQGDVWAHGTISDDRDKITGTAYPGAAILPLPVVDFESWKDLAKQGGTVGSVGVDYVPTPGNIGPKEILGNFRYTSNGTFTVKGPIYVHGNVTINGGHWNLDSALNDTGTVIIADGTISISGSAFGSSSGYIAFVSTNTANTETSPAINYQGSTNGEKVATFAPNGALTITGGAHIVAMMGKTLYINGGEIEYEEGGLTISMPPGGPGGTWLIKEWQEVHAP